jgi:hypothetical protein
MRLQASVRPPGAALGLGLISKKGEHRPISARFHLQLAILSPYPPSPPAQGQTHRGAR